MDYLFVIGSLVSVASRGFADSCGESLTNRVLKQIKIRILVLYLRVVYILL